jgi:hypothetical protein
MTMPKTMWPRRAVRTELEENDWSVGFVLEWRQLLRIAPIPQEDRSTRKVFIRARDEREREKERDTEGDDDNDEDGVQEETDAVLSRLSSGCGTRAIPSHRIINFGGSSSAEQRDGIA